MLYPTWFEVVTLAFTTIVFVLRKMPDYSEAKSQKVIRSLSLEDITFSTDFETLERYVDRRAGLTFAGDKWLAFIERYRMMM